jgi:hypothetical protein
MFSGGGGNKNKNKILFFTIFNNHEHFRMKLLVGRKNKNKSLFRNKVDN